jgi:hypothetical protein
MLEISLNCWKRVLTNGLGMRPFEFGVVGTRRATHSGCADSIAGHSRWI